MDLFAGGCNFNSFIYERIYAFIGPHPMYRLEYFEVIQM